MVLKVRRPLYTPNDSTNPFTGVFVRKGWCSDEFELFYVESRNFLIQNLCYLGFFANEECSVGILWDG